MRQTEQNKRKRQVLVTGVGAISAIGNGWEESRASLRLGISGISKANYFKSNFSDSLLFGEVKMSDAALRERCSAQMEVEYTRTTLLAIAAFQDAIEMAGLDQIDLCSTRTGLISSSTVGGMCYTDELYQDANKKADPSVYIRSYEGSDHTLRIAKRYGMKGFTDTINTACSSSANAIMLGSRLIKQGFLDRVIVGGADSLAKYTVNGFNALMILSPVACRPFDTAREGLTLGEGAAYLVLEASDVAGTKKCLAEVLGCGNSNDAFHPSATSDEARGPILAMNKALTEAGISPDQVDYINAHGTGTPNNDQTESYAFSQVFDRVPLYNSTKSYTGHTLAAAGALEASFCLLSMEHREIYPSLNCTDPIREFSFQPARELQTGKSLNHVLSNSFGFSGNCTSILFGHVHR